MEGRYSDKPYSFRHRGGCGDLPVVPSALAGSHANCNAIRDAIGRLADGAIAAGANGRVCAAVAAGRSALSVPADLALIGARPRDVLAGAAPAMPGPRWQDTQSTPCADKPKALREVLNHGNDGRTWRVRMQGLDSGGVAAAFHDITMQTDQRAALAAARQTVAAATHPRTDFLTGCGGACGQRVN